jgi:hypothetical protein
VRIISRTPDRDAQGLVAVAEFVPLVGAGRVGHLSLASLIARPDGLSEQLKHLGDAARLTAGPLTK